MKIVLATLLIAVAPAWADDPAPLALHPSISQYSPDALAAHDARMKAVLQGRADRRQQDGRMRQLRDQLNSRRQR